MIITKSKFAAKLTLPVRTQIFDAVTSNTLNPHLSECVMLGHHDIQKSTANSQISLLLGGHRVGVKYECI